MTNITLLTVIISLLSIVTKQWLLDSSVIKQKMFCFICVCILTWMSCPHNYFVYNIEIYWYGNPSSAALYSIHWYWDVVTMVTQIEINQSILFYLKIIAMFIFRTLDLCLQELTKCQFFLGILGNRYGWVPDKYEVPDTAEFDWVRNYPPGASVTELEMHSAALSQPNKIRERSFFYIRDSTFERLVFETFFQTIGSFISLVLRLCSLSCLNETKMFTVLFSFNF